KKQGKKQWQTPRKSGSEDPTQSHSIEAGDVGIWATCNLKMEGKCVSELKDLFGEYAQRLYRQDPTISAPEKKSPSPDVDIEAEIKKELANIRKPSASPLFTSVRLNTPCLIFFRTRSPIEPVSFVQAICDDAAISPERKQGRFIKRLTPMTVMGKANEKSLDEVAQQVLAPYFHGKSSKSKKFAIRPNLRNHNIMSRDLVIKKVASVVGHGHTVDLKNYELLILVEVYQNILGMSVVDGPHYDRLKRFNLAEIYEPSPKTRDS
ncbi:hypothetical protein M501DRAFT_941226, partial [Patellaria atrata CBS 101060]